MQILKNIYNPNSNQQAQSKGVRQHNSWVQNQNWLDSDVGTIWLAPKSNSEIHVRTCLKPLAQLLQIELKQWYI